MVRRSWSSESSFSIRSISARLRACVGGDNVTNLGIEAFELQGGLSNPPLNLGDFCGPIIGQFDLLDKVEDAPLDRLILRGGGVLAHTVLTSGAAEERVDLQVRVVRSPSRPFEVHGTAAFGAKDDPLEKVAELLTGVAPLPDHLPFRDRGIGLQP
jgi:hypothetical protein